MRENDGEREKERDVYVCTCTPMPLLDSLCVYNNIPFHFVVPPAQFKQLKANWNNRFEKALKSTLR